MELAAEIETLQQDITRLETELRPLQSDYDMLFRQVAQFEAENKHKHLTKPSLPQRRTDDDDDAPPLIHYSYFDDSIKKFFPAVAQKPEPSILDDLLRIQEKATAGQFALEESIMRFGGVTAFPINDRLYDTLDDALLGLRFDILAHSTNRYLTPHYIILRRRPLKLQENKWLVFRYTTPAFVPLDQFSKQLDVGDDEESLQKFAQSVRRYLVSVQYKHDKLDQLATIPYSDIGKESDLPIVTKIERDLECRRVTLFIGLQKTHQIELLCGLSQVESAACRVGNKEHAMYVETVLNNSDFKNLSGTMKSVLKYLLNHKLV